MRAPSEVGSSGASLGETLSVVEECDLEDEEEEEEEEEEMYEYEWEYEKEEDEIEEEDESGSDDENENSNLKKKTALDESTPPRPAAPRRLPHHPALTLRGGHRPVGVDNVKPSPSPPCPRLRQRRGPGALPLKRQIPGREDQEEHYETLINVYV
ncbi:hypothetical protein O3P69_015386 [Scylla paramamosain]|uniref:Uncharacterized protein n=1 Tax=Scylla paramamosain TaxID=85552 RepID=A0AAW0T644_SCYPA